MTEITQENPLGMKSILDIATKSPAQIYGENIKKAFTHDWIFVGWEKIIIAGTFFWAVFCIGRLIYGLF